MNCIITSTKTASAGWRLGFKAPPRGVAFPTVFFWDAFGLIALRLRRLHSPESNDAPSSDIRA